MPRALLHALVQDVLAYADTLEPEQRELLAQSVVDLFAAF
jgi:hypothetical protein